MQIGRLASSLYSNNRSSNSSSSVYTPPSGEIAINSTIEKIAIDKKAEVKKTELERRLTGFNEEPSDFIKNISRFASEAYRSILEGELREKISRMSQKEQYGKAATYYKAAGYKEQPNGFSLNLYS